MQASRAPSLQTPETVPSAVAASEPAQQPRRISSGPLFRDRDTHELLLNLTALGLDFSKGAANLDHDPAHAAALHRALLQLVARIRHGSGAAFHEGSRLSREQVELSGRHGEPTAVARVGALVIDFAQFSASLDGKKLELTAMEFRLLYVLQKRSNRVQTRSDLLRAVWNCAGDEPARRVDTHVNRLRLKLGHARRYIQTIRGLGYCFRVTTQGP